MDFIYKNFFIVTHNIVIFIVRIFKDFRINKIPSHSLGEMCTAIEIYICEKKLNPKTSAVIWFMGKLVANKFFLSK